MEEQKTVVFLCFYVWTLLDYHVWKCVRFCGRVFILVNKHVFTKTFDEISFVCELFVRGCERVLGLFVFV